MSDSFGYNGLGARVSTSGTNGSRTFRRAGIGVTSSVLDDGTKKYTPGVSSRQGSTSTFQHSGLKNATEQSNSSQSVTATKKYDAFGNTVSSSGTWQGPFGYAGSFGYQEDPNGLKLLGHRYYDPSLGRFITSDPIGDGSNWYVYAASNPVTNTDPTGLFVPLLVGAIVVGLALWPSIAEAPSSTLTAEDVARHHDEMLNSAFVWFLATLIEIGLAGTAARAVNLPGRTLQSKPRTSPGRDGGLSEHLIEKNAQGKTISVTHRVKVRGVIEHQHQTHIGKYGGQRRFPEEWIEFPTISKWLRGAGHGLNLPLGSTLSSGLHKDRWFH